MKGADVAMASIVQYNDWLEEEVRDSRGEVQENFFIIILTWKSLHIGYSQCSSDYFHTFKLTTFVVSNLWSSFL